MVPVFLCILFGPHYATFLHSRIAASTKSELHHIDTCSLIRFFFLVFLFHYFVSCIKLQDTSAVQIFSQKNLIYILSHKPWKLIWTSYHETLICFSWKILYKTLFLVDNSGILMYYDEWLVTCISMII